MKVLTENLIKSVAEKIEINLRDPRCTGVRSVDHTGEQMLAASRSVEGMLPSSLGKQRTL